MDLPQWRHLFLELSGVQSSTAHGLLSRVNRASLEKQSASGLWDHVPISASPPGNHLRFRFCLRSPANARCVIEPANSSLGTGVVRLESRLADDIGISRQYRSDHDNVAAGLRLHVRQ